MNKKDNPKNRNERSVEIAGIYGRKLSKEKRAVLLAVSAAACAMPMILGLKLWAEIPLSVPTGIIGANGNDDSLPRWAAALGLPGLMFILNAICHGQLWINQERMRIPPKQVRLLGHWGFPVLSVIFCSGEIRQAAGLTALSPAFTAVCALGLALVATGGHMWDCPRDAKIALRLPCAEKSDVSWNRVHRIAGGSWMAAGLLVILGAMLQNGPSAAAGVPALVGLLFPFAYCFASQSKSVIR